MAIDNTEDLLDSREIEARIDELESERSDIADSGSDEVEAELTAWDEANGEELQSLLELREECGSSEWQDGLALIRDSYFEDYARELAEDIGAISGDEKWPATCIDWERAAHELQQDYSSVEFDGVTYWYQG